ncbi:MAG TPA: 3'-5' exonuclease, partial [Afifellaceae bacterium]|nr:3'-5' exonuclease [Afifellaceae bacterium]
LIHSHARARSLPLMAAAGELVLTEEIKPKARVALADLLRSFGRWAGQVERMRHTDLAETILEESGYTEMWQLDRSPEAPGRLENLKELVNTMAEYESLGGFLEHVSLVMDADSGPGEQAVSLMTLHSAKGLEFDAIFLPGWEEGLFPHQRALDENGRAGLEEERRLAYVGLTRARRRAAIWLVANRRVHGLWQSTMPSRFLDELPEADVEVREAASYGGYGAGGMGGYASRFDKVDPFQSNYRTPGWQRAQSRRGGPGSGPGEPRRGLREPYTIEGELIAKSVVAAATRFSTGARVFHQKFGPGTVTQVDGNKLTVDFDKAGRKRVLDSFVEVG